MQNLQNLLQTYGDRITKTELVKCSVCPATFNTPYLRTPSGDFPIYNECYTHRGYIHNRAPNYQPKIIRTPEQWNKICPVQYRNTDVARLPQHMKTLLTDVKYNSRGMFVFGKSGTFKTRTMYLFLEKLFLEENKSVKVFDGMNFASGMQEAFMENKAETWMHSLSMYDCLYFDDLNQFIFTDRAEQVFYQVIELRMQKEKPTYYTSNLGTDLLEPRFTGSRGAPIIRRIEESCDMIIT